MEFPRRYSRYVFSLKKISSASITTLVMVLPVLAACASTRSASMQGIWMESCWVGFVHCLLKSFLSILPHTFNPNRAKARLGVTDHSLLVIQSPISLALGRNPKVELPHFGLQVPTFLSRNFQHKKWLRFWIHYGIRIGVIADTAFSGVFRGLNRGLSYNPLTKGA